VVVVMVVVLIYLVIAQHKYGCAQCICKCYSTIVGTVHCKQAGTNSEATIPINVKSDVAQHALPVSKIFDINEYAVCPATEQKDINMILDLCTKAGTRAKANERMHQVVVSWMSAPGTSTGWVWTCDESIPSIWADGPKYQEFTSCDADTNC